MQTFHKGIGQLASLLDELRCKRFLLVHDASYPYLSIREQIESIRIPRIVFSDFSPNPLHDDADKGVSLLKAEQCDAIVAVGGGSSLDVAKCIKLDSDMDIPLIAIPTTAGTGSESTRHIVVYRDGKKESLGDERVIPNFVIFEPKVLETLPRYQKICTMLDAFCQGIESYWSVNATAETRILSEKAIAGIIHSYKAYLELPFDPEVAEKIMTAANFSGQAINLTQTTAAHAMSYKLTSMYRLPHGHAVAICLPQVWAKMSERIEEQPNDPQNIALGGIFGQIANIMGVHTVQEAIGDIVSLLRYMGISSPVSENYEADIKALALSVNPIRLKNNPVIFTEDELEAMYRNIVVGK